MTSCLDALGDDHERLCAVLEEWGKEIRAQAGYLGGGMHDLARAGRR